jgi:GH15 family glucan-1,4-alpha-glucosidase
MDKKGFSHRGSWAECTQKATKHAQRSGFDVERILFTGRSLEEAVYDAAAYAIEVSEGMRKMSDPSSQTFLKRIRDCLATKLELWWDGDGLNPRPENLSKLALSFLYLFPKLWKATNKQLSLDKMKALDLEELLSERRKPR